MALPPVVWIVVYLGAGTLTSSSDVDLPVAFESECGRLLVETDGAPVFHASSTHVALVLDEEWRALFGEDASSVARALLWEASALFRQVDIHLPPVRVSDWSSPEGATTARELLSVVENTVELADADLVIALTGQRLDGADGRARRDGRYAVIEHHPGYPERDGFVLAHEVAHLFGANHVCDVPGREGLLAKSGYEDPDLICHCTKRVLETNAAAFHEQLDSANEVIP